LLEEVTQFFVTSALPVRGMGGQAKGASLSAVGARLANSMRWQRLQLETWAARRWHTVSP